MNRIDRQNLSAMANSVNASSPIGLNTATGSPDLGVRAPRPAGSVADDASVANSSSVIEPKPGSKFALPEDFGTVPVSMNSHGDYTGSGLAPSPGRREQGSAQQDQVIAPKPGSKFALPEDFGTVPVGMNSHGDYTGPGLAPRPGRNEQEGAQRDQVIAPKPGSKFALPEEDECGAMPVPLPLVQPEGEDAQTLRQDPLEEEAAFSGYPDARSPRPQPIPTELPRPAASVPDDMSLPNSGEILTPKPGSKFAAGQPLR